MSEYNFTVEGGSAVRLPTAGKYCDRDIVVTATGGKEDLNTILTEQENSIAELKELLDGKARGLEIARAIANRTIESYSDNEITDIGFRGFSHCTKLKSVNLPKVATIGQHGFNSCSVLERVEFPKLTTLTPGDNFTYCYALEYADLGLVTSLPSWCLANDRVLQTVILRKTDKICTLLTTNALSGTPIANGTGYVYVPANLVESYKAATNWTTYAAQIRAIEVYPEICGGEE